MTKNILKIAHFTQKSQLFTQYCRKFVSVTLNQLLKSEILKFYISNLHMIEIFFGNSVGTTSHTLNSKMLLKIEHFDKK